LLLKSDEISILKRKPFSHFQEEPNKDFLEEQSNCVYADYINRIPFIPFIQWSGEGMNRIGYNAGLWSEMACVQTSSISFTSDETTFWDRAFGTGFF